MEYRSIHCPYCGLELQVPVGIEQIVCMYCARPIDIKKLLSPTAAESDGGKQLQNALALLDPALFRFEKEQKAFNRTEYSDSFASYSSRLQPALEALQGAGETDCQDFAQAVLSDMADYWKSCKIRSSKSSRFFSYRMMLTVYFIPSLHDSSIPEAAAVLSAFLKLWNSKYPKEPLSAASFQKINSGWRKKGCYITSAVCRTLHKPDNCIELQALRRFRDSWLLRQPYGTILVREYYIFAPFIAEAINASGQAASVYLRLWKMFIFPCVQDAVSGNNERCFKRYTMMMFQLERQYLS
ncbi:MAG TPA: hypothetical protein DHW78_08540 [Ruminococcaceae bacterium]|nr:hypothetical protein [Oscillospiraceae bacterium]HCA71496.1 hypothetical protein [Oscillospiraceae bacterium]HCC02496.1 hypothetical protein [Oscillospiraceae bacterium]HCM24353.1 hypothetical protein [Oscillospiraceae bacterium]